MSELRWNALRGEWTVTATHRQERTFFPPPDYCPLCPTRPGGFPTEVPYETYDLVSFENRFPSLQRLPPEPAVSGDDLQPVRPAYGACEVVLYTPEHDVTLAELPVSTIDRLVRVWQHRTAEMGARSDIAYVMPFENKGEEVGVTLSHPHGQIYAYPFIPPHLAAELAQARAHRAAHGGCLGCSLVAREEEDGRRIVGANDDWVAYVPFAARWPYETHVVARRHAALLTDLRPRQRRALARLLKALLLGFDRLFDRSFPYIMVVHQAPVDPATHADAHLHIEFYPPLRSAGKLKYLAGSEAGAGMFIDDTLPETTARALRACVDRGA
jgi:UDPglucose--hexose-1-phosphate uridylyltransferase